MRINILLQIQQDAENFISQQSHNNLNNRGISIKGKGQSQRTMKTRNLSLVYLCLFVLLYQSLGHLLLPPFLPTACVNQYYEQKFKISQLDSAEFKISGLPKDIFWTSNGTIFGKPSVFGQWKLSVSYDSVTQSGSYETVLTIRNNTQIKSTSQTVQNTQILLPPPSALQLIFPQNLIFVKGQQQQIQFKVKYSSFVKQQSIIEWKFITLPQGVTRLGDGRLSVKIGTQGMYVLRIQASDLLGNFVQACVTLNVQNSRANLTQSFLIPDKNSAINRLLEVKQKQTQLTRQLSSAVNKLGQQNQTLKAYEEAFARIGNNLIQLQSQASISQKRITDTLKSKLLKQQKLKQATQIVQNAEDNLNLALIQQKSNDNLLLQAQKEKLKAQQSYDKASKDLDNQLRLMKTIQARLVNKQQDKQNAQSVLSIKKARYSQLGVLLINKDKQLGNINQEITKSERELLLAQQQLTAQQSLLNSQQLAYSSIQQHIIELQYIIKTISQQLIILSNKKQTITRQCQSLQNLLETIKLTQVITLQEDMKSTQMAIQQLLFDSITLWNEVNYQSAITKEYVNKVQFGGCVQNSDYNIEGVFKIKQGSIINNKGSLQFVSQSGHRVLFGKCTKMPAVIKDSDTVIISGYTLQGVIHANSITVAHNNC